MLSDMVFNDYPDYHFWHFYAPNFSFFQPSDKVPSSYNTICDPQYFLVVCFIIALHKSGNVAFNPSFTQKQALFKVMRRSCPGREIVS